MKYAEEFSIKAKIKNLVPINNALKKLNCKLCYAKTYKGVLPRVTYVEMYYKCHDEITPETISECINHIKCIPHFNKIRET